MLFHAQRSEPCRYEGDKIESREKSMCKVTEVGISEEY